MADRKINHNIDLQGSHKIKNAVDGIDPQDYATVAQLGEAGGNITVGDGDAVSISGINDLRFVNGDFIVGDSGGGVATVSSNFDRFGVPLKYAFGLNPTTITALNSTPYSLVDGEADKVLVPISLTFAMIYNSSPYTVGGGSLALRYAGFSTNLISLTSAGFLNQTSDKFAIVPMLATSVLNMSSIVGQDLQLVETVSNPSGGNSDITLTMTYFLANTT